MFKDSHELLDDNTADSLQIQTT